MANTACELIHEVEYHVFLEEYGIKLKQTGLCLGVLSAI
jgi:hypothetical protein